MYLTLSNHSRPTKLPKNSSPSTANPAPSNNKRQQPSQSFSRCPDFVFGNCVSQNERINTEQNEEIYQNYQRQGQTHKKDTHILRPKKVVEQRSNRKYKICLSLQQSDQKYETPKKRPPRNNLQGKSYSENKQINQIQRLQKENDATQNKVMNLMIKTEPAQERKGLELNIHQLKESMKPSTNIMTPASKSLKQSNNSSSKKVQLTISNHFKSSIAQQKKQAHEKVSTNICTGRKIESNFASQQVFVEQSFMTAKLHNIYGEIQNSFQQNPSSNIIYYNQIMANEMMWKRMEPFSYSQPNCQIKRVLLKEEEVPSQAKKLLAAKNTSILQNIEDEEVAERAVVAVQGKVDIRQKFMERKYIGEYAKTIKTFNQSEFKSEHQSVVLEHGLPYQGSFQPFLLDRGSIKEYARQPESETIRRHCSSFGEQQLNSYQIVRERYREYVSHPIEQSSYDAERDG